MTGIDDARTTSVRYHAGIATLPEGQQEAIDGVIATVTSESQKVASRQGRRERTGLNAVPD